MTSSWEVVSEYKLFNISSNHYAIFAFVVRIFRGLLDDENFHADIQSLAEEPIPYFRQFQTVESGEQTSSVAFPEDMDFDVVYPSLKVWNFRFDD